MKILRSQLQDSFTIHAKLPALELSNRVYCYDELAAICNRLRLLPPLQQNPEGAIGVFTAQEALTYAAFPAAILNGSAYIPLSPTLPVSRILRIIEQTKLQTLLVTESAMHQIAEILALTPSTLHIAYAAELKSTINLLKSRHSRHFFWPIPEGTEELPICSHEETAAAYVLYTSGSTGEAKPVAISQRNLESYLASIFPILGLRPDDRCAQANDLSFDLSIHDMLTTWLVGACLVPIPQRYRLTPARTIAERKLTVWLSTPHVAASMFATSTIGTNAFPALRLMQHAGEPFPIALAKQWHIAAPNCRILNLYGPSETTIAISAYEWQEETSSSDTQFVPIGKVFSSHSFALRSRPDLQLSENEGELCVHGPQVFQGYLVQSESTGLESDSWYTTGDLCRSLPSGDLLFLGRFDQTIKIRGFRVNILEIEHALRTTTGVENVAAIAWPVTLLAAKEIYAFVQSHDPVLEYDTIAALSKLLPPYMVPTRIHSLETLPQTASGKVDRKALVAILERLKAGSDSAATDVPRAEE